MTEEQREIKRVQLAGFSGYGKQEHSKCKCEKDEYQAEADRNDIIFYAECQTCRNRAYHVTIR